MASSAASPSAVARGIYRFKPTARKLDSSAPATTTPGSVSRGQYYFRSTRMTRQHVISDCEPLLLRTVERLVREPPRNHLPTSHSVIYPHHRQFADGLARQIQRGARAALFIKPRICRAKYTWNSVQFVRQPPAIYLLFGQFFRRSPRRISTALNRPLPSPSARQRDEWTAPSRRRSVPMARSGHRLV